ncbi:MAG: sigma-70 family RNA polymerase sigma factor [Thermoleophilaceae bacterium]|nr:sigma-70 family RNA polymerase sigma factor [Thermoleophilaceae bacterium]
MERRANLRPVLSRPERPISPAEAIGWVALRLPELDEPAHAVLALRELVGRSRPEIAAERGLTELQVGEALVRARKALRRSVAPLPGSGWCERAERLLSDDLDGELDERGTRILTAHLARCQRCVEHDRRLTQARDGLVRDLATEEPAAPMLTVAPPELEAEEPEPEPEPEVIDMPDTEPTEEREIEVVEVEPEPEPDLGRRSTTQALGNLAWRGVRNGRAAGRRLDRARDRGRRRRRARLLGDETAAGSEATICHDPRGLAAEHPRNCSGKIFARCEHLDGHAVQPSSGLHQIRALCCIEHYAVDRRIDDELEECAKPAAVRAPHDGARPFDGRGHTSQGVTPGVWDVTDLEAIEIRGDIAADDQDPGDSSSPRL